MSLDSGYVTADYLRKTAQMGHAIKQLSYEHMAIREGDTLLDIGCGPGVDTVPLAALCGNQGRVIGIDSDNAMLAEADKAAQDAQCQSRTEHRRGSALTLPLDDNSVSACRAERLLQVLPPEAEQTVITEMVRVTRPGGRLVLIDTDWSSASVDFSDTRLERRLMEFFTLQMRPNGIAGRRLYSLIREHELEETRLDVLPMVQHRFDDTPFGDWLIDTALSEGVMDGNDAQRWRQELQEREQRQRFHACVHIVVASGRIPDKTKPL